MAELNPCPFCGNDDLEIDSHFHSVYKDTYYYVQCCCCGASSTGHLHKEIAIKRWNRRVPMPTVLEYEGRELVLCRDCKHFTEGMAIGMCKRNPDKPIVPMPYNAFCSFGKRRAANE